MWNVVENVQFFDHLHSKIAKSANIIWPKKYILRQKMQNAGFNWVSKSFKNFYYLPKTFSQKPFLQFWYQTKSLRLKQKFRFFANFECKCYKKEHLKKFKTLLFPKHINFRLHLLEIPKRVELTLPTTRLFDSLFVFFLVPYFCFECNRETSGDVRRDWTDFQTWTDVC